MLKKVVNSLSNNFEIEIMQKAYEHGLLLGGTVSRGLPNLSFMLSDKAKFNTIYSPVDTAQYMNGIFADATLLLYTDVDTCNQILWKELTRKHCIVLPYDVSQKVIGNLAIEIATKIAFQNIETLHITGTLNKKYTEKAILIVTKIIEWIKGE